MFLELIETVSVIGVVEQVRDFASEKNGASLEVRILDPKAGTMFKLTVSEEEAEAQGIDYGAINIGLACRLIAEKVTLSKGPRAGQSFLSVKKCQFGKPGERLRVAGQEAVSAEVGKYESVGARLDAKMNGAVPVGAGVVGAEDGPF